MEQRGATICDKDGEASHMLGCTHEITDRKEREALQVQTQLKYELMLSALKDAVYGLDREGKIVFANPSACNLLGWMEQEMLGRYQSDFLLHRHPDGNVCDMTACSVYTDDTTSECPEKLFCAMHQVIREGKPHATHELAICKDGTRIAIECSATPIFDGGIQLGVVIVFHAFMPRK